MAFVFPHSILNDDDALLEIAYLNGLDANGDRSARNFWTDNGWVPHKWQNDGGDHASVGAGGGVVTYSFDTSHAGGYAWTAAAKASFVASLALWSDIANIRFQEAKPGETGQVVFYNYDGEYETDSQYGDTRNDTVAKNQTGEVHVYTDPSHLSWYGDITSFSTYGGYGVGAVTHELGHLLGLGHGGNYNGAVDPPTQQYTVYDDRLYSVMSYIDTFNAYYTNDDTMAAQWGTTDDGWYRETSYTPMVLDILAIQQLYGASTNGAYGGGQVFGFHCNIQSASSIYFDFTIDAAPIVTMFDYGLNNTLDLSGYSMSCKVNLNQGAFSSVGGLVNNVCISYGTHIETAIGGGGDDVFYVNQDADTIHGGAGRDTVVFAGLRANYTITYESGGVVIADATTVYTLSDVETAQFSDKSETLCFLSGTRIRTPSGEVAVEKLRPGDLALTAEGEARPVVWLGRLKVAARFVDPVRSHPIRIRAGALGDNLPLRDLLVSPDHALLVEGLLIHAGALVNGTSIVRETRVPEFFDYYHVELADHALVLAEGVPAETFIDNVDRMHFDNWAEHEALYPEGRVLEEMPLPRAKSRRQVPARIRAALDRRAEAIGAALAACA